jgi:hypothetical protein
VILSSINRAEFVDHQLSIDSPTNAETINRAVNCADALAAAVAGVRLDRPTDPIGYRLVTRPARDERSGPLGGVPADPAQQVRVAVDGHPDLRVAEPLCRGHRSRHLPFEEIVFIVHIDDHNLGSRVHRNPSARSLCAWPPERVTTALVEPPAQIGRERGVGERRNKEDER